MDRTEKLQHWLRDFCQLSSFQLDALQGDASFRRYFRVRLTDQSFIAMDAPPTLEKCESFVAISKGLRKIGLNTPVIFASDLINGFLLISDFGNQLLLKILNEQNAESLYEKAIDSLLTLQTCQTIEGLEIPFFTEEFMRKELELCKDWFFKRHLNIIFKKDEERLLEKCFDFLSAESAKQPYVFMHRDYHSANLMLLPDNQLGILDFQDAFRGPLTYDLVSLLRDCYISWPEIFINKLALKYYGKITQSDISQEEFLLRFDLMGLQRQLKALLTFSRKLHRDGNSNYIKYIPPTMHSIIKVSGRYEKCHILQTLLEKGKISCAQ